MPKAPGRVHSHQRMCGVSGQVFFLQTGSAAGWRGEKKQDKVVSCKSLLKMLMKSVSTFGKCSECFYFQCPNFSGFRKILLSRKKVILTPSPCGVTAQRYLSLHLMQRCFLWVTAFEKPSAGLQLVRLQGRLPQCGKAGCLARQPPAAGAGFGR